MSEVKNLQNVKVEAEGGNRLERQCPDILAFSMSGCSYDVHNRWGYAADKGGQDEPIIYKKIHLHDDFRADTEQDDDAGDDAESDGDINERLGFVTYGNVARGASGILSDCIRC